MDGGRFPANGGDFHATGGKKRRKQKLAKIGKINRGKKRRRSLSLLRSGILSHSAGAEERGVEDHKQYFVYLKRAWQTSITGIRQTILGIRHGENQGLRILENQMKRTETGGEWADFLRDLPQTKVSMHT